MLKWQGWDINCWPGGWVCATDQTGVQVVLRYLPVGEGENLRLRLHLSLMMSDQPITARRWRDFPIAEIEQFFTIWQRTDPEQFAVLAGPAEAGDPFSLHDVARFFIETPAMKIAAHLPVSKYIDDEVDPNTPWEPVKRPEDGRITDEFLENLATVYSYLVARGEDAPVTKIAKGADVPVGTVHRWVLRARKQGFLPPAVKGKAG